MFASTVGGYGKGEEDRIETLQEENTLLKEHVEEIEMKLKIALEVMQKSSLGIQASSSEIMSCNFTPLCLADLSSSAPKKVDRLKQLHLSK